MAEKRAPRARKPKAPPMLAFASFREFFSWWTVQGSVVISLVSGWYATNSWAQANISATTFAGIIAFANLALVVLRGINQGTTSSKKS